MWGLLNRRLLPENLFYWEGADYFPLFHDICREELMRYKQAGYQKVRVRIIDLPAGGEMQSRGYCLQLKDKVFLIDEALAAMPVPVKDCELSFKGDKRVWCCRCLYSPMGDEGAEAETGIRRGDV
jgi:hypothetical protein